MKRKRIFYGLDDEIDLEVDSLEELENMIYKV